MKKYLLALLVLVTGISFLKADLPSGEVYLQVNIHYFNSGGELKGSYANFTGPHIDHSFWPVNTKVILKKWRRGMKIYKTDESACIYFEFHKRRMKMSLEEYVKIITSPSPKNLDSFADEDLEGIKEGKALKGMTKDGVMVALGYPATHRTPSLKANQWVFWRNRFKSRAVMFGNEGTVISVNPGW